MREQKWKLRSIFLGGRGAVGGQNCWTHARVFFLPAYNSEKIWREAGGEKIWLFLETGLEKSKVSKKRKRRRKEKKRKSKKAYCWKIQLTSEISRCVSAAGRQFWKGFPLVSSSLFLSLSTNCQGDLDTGWLHSYTCWEQDLHNSGEYKLWNQPACVGRPCSWHFNQLCVAASNPLTQLSLAERWSKKAHPKQLRWESHDNIQKVLSTAPGT